MIWSIFDNDAHRIVSKKGLNLLQMENKLDSQLAKETPSSLIEWMQSKIELSECVNCDEVKETHQICMDCIGKLIKENQENLYTEEDLEKVWLLAVENTLLKALNKPINKTYYQLLEELKQK